MHPKLAIRFVALAVCLAFALGIASTASATITTNGNGGPTDVGTWYLPGGYSTSNCASGWSGNGINYLPLSYWSAIPGSGALSGTYESFNPCDSSIIAEDLAILAAAKVDFILIDLTNEPPATIAAGCSSSDQIVVWACDVATAINTWNSNPSNTWKIKYAISVCPPNQGTPEALSQAVYTGFVTNSSFGGIGNAYQINGQPLLVNFGGPGSGPGSDFCSGTCTYADDFYFGNASQQGAGEWGWAPPGVSASAGGITQVDPNGVVEDVSPGWFNQGNNVQQPYYSIWTPREDGTFYQANWNVVYTSNPAPRVVMLSAYNDWLEEQALGIGDTVSPTYIPNPVYDMYESGNSSIGARMDEAWTFPDQNIHNDGYWNYTTAAICYLRNNTSTNCGTNSSPFPSLPQPAPNMAVSAEASASSTVNSNWAASYVNDGNPDSIWSSQNDGTTDVLSPGEWIELTWPTAQTFNTVVLMGRYDRSNCFPVSFEIQVWDESTSSWVTRVQETNFQQPYVPGQPIAFTWGFSDTTKQVRVLVTQVGPDGSGGDYAQLSEFEVLNETNTPTIPVLTNWGFETPAQRGPNSQANPSGAGWTFSGSSGVQELGSGYDSPMAPQGIQTAYLTGTSASISQAITLPSGTYFLRFLASEPDGGSQPINVSYGGVNIGSFSGFSSDSFHPYVTGSFTSTGASQPITFTGSGSGTALIDEVQIFNQTAVSPVGGNNLLLNPSWGTGDLTDWNLAYCCGGGPVDAFVQSFGSGSQFYFPGEAHQLDLGVASGAFDIAAYQNLTGQPASAVFTFLVYAQTSANTTGAGLFVQDGPGGTSLCNTSIPANISTWTLYTCTGTVPPDGKLTVNLTNNEGSGNANWWAMFVAASLTD